MVGPLDDSQGFLIAFRTLECQSDGSQEDAWGIGALSFLPGTLKQDAADLWGPDSVLVSS